MSHQHHNTVCGKLIDGVRMGRFSLPMALVEAAPLTVKALLDSCNIAVADRVEAEDVIDFLAISDHFRPLANGEEVPFYTSVLDVERGRLVRWEPCHE